MLFCEGAAADERHARRIAGEVHCRLAGGVRAADDEDAPAGELPGLGG